MLHAVTKSKLTNSGILPILICLCLMLWPITVAAQEDHEAEESHSTEIHQPGEEAASDGHDHEEGWVRLTPEEIKEFGIEIGTAGPGILHSEIAVPGEVVVNGERLAHIVPRFPGVVTEVKKSIGDTVVIGDVLAVVESNEGLASYKMTSLTNGVIIDKHITIGEVNFGDEPAFIIADLDTVWINLSIYQMHLPRVQPGQSVLLSLGEGLPEVAGQIDYLSPIVDKHTRTATARVVVPNLQGTLRPGLFVEGRIRIEGKPAAILVPKTAVQKIENETVLFVEDHEGFMPREVKVGGQNAAYVEIIGGLKAGERYVIEGGFIIKAEMGKGSFGHDHAH